MNPRFSTILLAFLMAALWAPVRSAASGDVPNKQDTTIIDAINDANGTVYIYQSEALDKLVERKAVASEGNAGAATANKGNVGYRIQVFMDNNMRTAKANAEHRKRMMEQNYPEWRAYITFDSPYWRVRVGDFRTHTEADAAMRELKNTYPAFADDLRLVRERINVVNN